jgi:hypothetical protein
LGVLGAHRPARRQRDQLVFRIPPDRSTPNIAPSWNVAPTDPLPVVRYDAKDRQRSLDVMRWGLVPLWAKDIKVGLANINAKAESIENKPAFREAFRQRRCLVPVDNFYEWAKTVAGKQPYGIALKGGGLMALAGIWENWRSPVGERVRSFAIITTEPNECPPRCITGCRRSSRPRIQLRHPDGVDGWKLVKALDLRPADQLPDRTARHRASAPDAVAIAQRRGIGALVTALNEVWTRLTPAPRRLIQKVRRQRPCDSLSSAEWARENAGLWRCCFERTSC